MKFSLPSNKTVETDAFIELLGRAQIIDWQGSVTHSELFARLSEEFATCLALDAAYLKQGLLAREAQGGTELAPGIAVPHVEIDESGRLELIVVRVRKGVLFNPEDPAVKAIFAVATSRDERTAYLRVLSAIAQILRAPTFAERWLDLEGPESIREFLRSAKRLRI